MILGLILGAAVIAFVYWLFSDEQRANTITTGINAASLIYYVIVGFFVLLAAGALLTSGELSYSLFGALILLIVLIVARVRLANTKNAIAK
jgi:hypothetical protein